MSNADLIQMTIIFEGKVQGVGFRATARSFANELDVVGSAQNLADGSVKVIIQGNQLNCEALVNKLRSHFQITNIQVALDSISHRLNGFAIS